MYITSDTSPSFPNCAIVWIGYGWTQIGITDYASLSGKPNLTTPSFTSASITGNTASSNTSTGALTVVGGCGIGGKVYIGNNLSCGGTGSQLTINYNTTQSATLAVASTGTLEITPSSGTVNLIGSQTSVGTDSGCLICNGGVGINNNLYTGGKVVIQSTIVSSGTSTGSLVVSGGVGIAKNVKIGGTLDITTDSTAVIQSALNPNLVEGGGYVATAVGKSMSNMNCFICRYNHSSADSDSNNAQMGVISKEHFILSGTEAKINFTAESSNTLTGALIIKGGVGIGKNIYCGGEMSINTTMTASTYYTKNAASLFQYVMGSASNNYQWLGIGSKNSGNELAVQLPATAACAFSVYSAPTAASELKCFTVSGSTAGGAIQAYHTSDSSDTQSGAFQIAGGCSIAKKLYVGSEVNILDNSENSNPLKMFNNSMGVGKITTVSLGRAATTYDCALLRYYHAGNGSMSNNISLNLYGKDGISINGNSVVYVNGTSDASDTNTGALQVRGGASFAKSLYVAGNVVVPWVPTAGNHLCNKTYVDGKLTGLGITAITSAIGNLTDTTKLNVSIGGSCSQITCPNATTISPGWRCFITNTLSTYVILSDAADTTIGSIYPYENVELVCLTNATAAGTWIFKHISNIEMKKIEVTAGGQSTTLTLTMPTKYYIWSSLTISYQMNLPANAPIGWEYDIIWKGVGTQIVAVKSPLGVDIASVANNTRKKYVCTGSGDTDWFAS
jgi:hypothetical protein